MAICVNVIAKYLRTIICIFTSMWMGGQNAAQVCIEDLQTQTYVHTYRRHEKKIEQKGQFGAS